MLTFTNPLRPWLHPLEHERQDNPSTAVIAALAVLGLGAGGYGLYRYMHRKPSTPTGGGTQPGGGTVPGGGGSKLPTGPTTPTGGAILSVQSPYMSGSVDHAPGGGLSNQYQSYAHFPALGRYGEGNQEQYSTTDYFATQAQAVARAKFLEWYFGKPHAQDDIYISSRDTGFFDGHPRGAVWQSVQNGDFYYSIVGPGTAGGEVSEAGWPGIDQAEDALWQDLQTMV